MDLPKVTPSAVRDNDIELPAYSAQETRWVYRLRYIFEKPKLHVVLFIIKLQIMHIVLHSFRCCLQRCILEGIFFGVQELELSAILHLQTPILCLELLNVSHQDSDRLLGKIVKTTHIAHPRLPYAFESHIALRSCAFDSEPDVDASV